MAGRERAGLGVTLVLALLGVAGLGLWRLAAPPAGPVDVPFDRVACERCRMLVSDPRFAVQLHDATGTVRFFDDPGCALLHPSASADGARLWFHEAHGERWLAEDVVGFEPIGGSPMGYGFAAVPRGASEATLTPAQLRARLLAREAEAAR